MSISSPPHFDPLRFVRVVAVLRSRQERIAEIAYYRALARGFEPGHELEDWLVAEAEINQRDP
jgi:hypothetical protein